MIETKWQPTRNTMSVIENSALLTICELNPTLFASPREYHSEIAIRNKCFADLKNIFKVLRKDADKYTQEG